MRILLIAPPWFAVPPASYGGIENVVGLLAEGLVDAGHDVTLFASGGSRTRARLRSVYDTPPSNMLGDPATELAHLLAGHLDTGGYDVVHDHTLLGAALGAIHSAVPIVHTLHGPWTGSTRRVYATLAQRIHLVAISHDQASRAPDIPLAGVVHNGIDLDLHPLGLDRGNHLTFVGRASPEKGPEIAIEVARRLGRPLAMAIKVNEPAERDYWEQTLYPLLRHADVDVRFDVTPEQKISLLCSAHAVLFPIQWPEPFGLVMAEANACGTPVVAFAEGAAPEVLDHGRTGFVVAPGDIEAMCAAVERAGDLDPHACRRHVADNFSARQMVAGYLTVYAAARHPAGRRAHAV